MYIIEGNIGVGKSTFLEEMRKSNLKIEIVPEPLENWTKENFGKSLLSNFYENIPRWAYTLETLTMIYRAKSHLIEQQSAYPFRLIERSIYSGHFCFAQNDFANNHLTHLEWKIYNEWVNFLIKDQCLPPHGFIYLRADPSVCFNRIKKRDRAGENQITLNYLKQIHYWHEKFLVEKDGIFQNLKNIPVLILDCNENLTNISKLAEKFAKPVELFLQKTAITKPIQKNQKVLF